MLAALIALLIAAALFVVLFLLVDVYLMLFQAALDAPVPEAHRLPS